MLVRPMAMIPKPETRVRVSTLRSTRLPTTANEAPRMMKTIVNPATNNIEGLRRQRPPGRASPPTAPTNPRQDRRA